LWATLKLSLPLNPGNAGDALFDCLTDFVEAAGEEGKLSIIFPYHLSKYQAVADLLAGITDSKHFQKKPMTGCIFSKPNQIRGGDLYTPLLISLSQPFPKFIKKLSLWFKEKKFGLWPSALQSEKPVSLGQHLFLTNTMDTKALQHLITESIQDVLVSLQGKMISLDVQGQVKPEDQVQALHLYVDELDVAMVKPPFNGHAANQVKCTSFHFTFGSTWCWSWTQC